MRNLQPVDRNFNSVIHSFTLMITYSFLNSSVPTTAPRCLLPSLVIFIFAAVPYFSGFTISHVFFVFGKYPTFGPKVFSLFHQVSIFLTSKDGV